MTDAVQRTDRGRQYSPIAQDAEVERLTVASAGCSPFDVLELPYMAREFDVRSRSRALSRLVHPDKCRHARATDAFQVIAAARDELLNSDLRLAAVDVYYSALLKCPGHEALRVGEPPEGALRSAIRAEILRIKMPRAELRRSWLFGSRDAPLSAALRLENREKPKYAGWRVVLTGHSQGASIAALLAVCLRHELEFPLDAPGSDSAAAAAAPVAPAAPSSSHSCVQPPERLPHVPIYALCYAAPRMVCEQLQQVCAER